MNKFTGMQYLQIDIANCMGLDKKSWEERLDFVNQNEKVLEQLVNKADSPAEYTAAVHAYRLAEKGEPISHPIHLDAVSSGSQWLSVLTHDRPSALMCNVLNSGSRKDLYTDIYKKIEKIIGSNPFITRDKVKKAIMTSLYGSTATPKELFGENIHIFEQVMSREMSKSWELNKLLTDNWISDQAVIKWIMPDNFHVNCTVKCMVEDEFIFRGKVRKFIHQEIKESKIGRSLGANCIHSVDSFAVREITALAMHNPEQIQRVSNFLNQKGKTFNLREANPKNIKMVSTLVQLYEKSGFLSARVLDYIDEASISLVPEDELRELLSLVPKKPFEVLCVHDAFLVHPNYGNDVRWLYITTLARVCRSNMLEYILQQMYQKPEIKVNLEDNNMWKDVLKAEYALS